MGVDALGFPGGLLRLHPAFAYVEPPSSWPLPLAECLTLAPNNSSSAFPTNSTCPINWITYKYLCTPSPSPPLLLPYHFSSRWPLTPQHFIISKSYTKSHLAFLFFFRFIPIFSLRLLAVTFRFWQPPGPKIIHYFLFLNLALILPSLIFFTFY